MKTLITLLLSGLCASSVNVRAQDVPVSTTATGVTNTGPTVINHAANALNNVAAANPNAALATPASVGASLLTFLAENGQSGQGYAWSLGTYSPAQIAKGKKNYQGGVLLTEGVNITKKLQSNFLEFHVDADAAQFLKGDTTKIQLGLSPCFTVFSTPQLQTAKTATGLLNWLPVNLSKIQIAPYIGADADRLFNGKLARKTTAVGIEVKWDF